MQCFVVYYLKCFYFNHKLNFSLLIYRERDHVLSILSSPCIAVSYSKETLDYNLLIILQIFCISSLINNTQRILPKWIYFEYLKRLETMSSEVSLVHFYLLIWFRRSIKFLILCLNLDSQIQIHLLSFNHLQFKKTVVKSVRSKFVIMRASQPIKESFHTKCENHLKEEK